ncbi:hypothetical protein CABS01_10791 [Colletotrichum abscissum]|nr:uncharacterized protein CABS01_10791 [Colletotrichum abscissum]KAK1497813.1 hypothetical protein CABS01_10791 [Colletotrichum abscissum]
MGILGEGTLPYLALPNRIVASFITSSGFCLPLGCCCIQVTIHLPTLHYLPVHRSDHVEIVVVVVRHVSVIALQCLSSHLLVSFGQTMVQDPEWHLSTTSPLCLTPFDRSLHYPHRTAAHRNDCTLSRQIPRFQVPTLRLAAPSLSTPDPPPIQPNPASSWDNACTTLPPRHRQADRLTPQSGVQPPLLWVVPPSRCYLGAALPLFTPGTAKQTPSTMLGLINADIGIVPSHHLLSAALLPTPLTSTSPHLSMTSPTRTASTQAWISNHSYPSLQLPHRQSLPSDTRVLHAAPILSS